MSRLCPWVRNGASSITAMAGSMMPGLEVRRLLTSGGFQVLGEVMAQYDGIAPDDSRLEPYWALAEELDVPVGIHLGPGGPGEVYFGTKGYRARGRLRTPFGARHCSGRRD